MKQRVQPETLTWASGAMCFDAARIQKPSAALFDPASGALAATAVTKGGRQAAWFVQGEFGRGVLRHYRRGGVIARLSADRYLWTGAAATRSFAEYELLRFMHDQGLRVPRPLAAAYWRCGLSYRAAILIERIDAATPLAIALEHADPAAVARAIFDMHAANVWHADLNAYNILLDERSQVWIIDFDKGRQTALRTEQRQANLLRLRRSLVKIRGEQALPWWTRLNDAYQRI